MELKTNIKNDALNRQELVFELELDKTPSFSEMKKKISEEFSKPYENVDVLEICGKFGQKIFIVKADVYDSKEGLEQSNAMKKTQKQRNAEKEEKKKAQEEAKKQAVEEAKAVESSAEKV